MSEFDHKSVLSRATMAGWPSLNRCHHWSLCLSAR